MSGPADALAQMRREDGARGAQLEGATAADGADADGNIGAGPRRVTLGGRIFVEPEDRTVANDVFVMGLAEALGVARLEMLEGEGYDDFARRILVLVSSSPRWPDLLGALLLPDGLDVTDWTPEVARSTGAYIAQLTGRDDKVTVARELAAGLLAFFAAGLVSVTISPRSSAAGGASPNPSEAAIVPDPGRG